MRTIGILGGTFDPIHFGHLRAAVELYQLLQLKEVRFIPCQKPVHKHHAYTSAQHRLHMLELAIADEPGLVIDTRELVRTTPSFMYVTLQSLRDELGPEAPLALIMGVDALAAFDGWHCWQQIFDLAHIIAIQRPGCTLSLHGEVGRAVSKRLVSDVSNLDVNPAGSIFLQTVALLDISATAIRNLIAQKRSPRYLLPDSVLQYIRENRIY